MCRGIHNLKVHSSSSTMKEPNWCMLDSYREGYMFQIASLKEQGLQKLPFKSPLEGDTF